MADFPKKQQQCLIPKYLLDYLGEVNELHPDPSDLGGGDNIEPGTGIVITGDETKTISVDDETVAMVANLAPVAFSGSYSNLSDKPDLSVYELKEDAFTGDYDDLTNKPDLSVYELKSDAFSGNYNDLTNKPTIPNRTSAPFLGVGQADDGLVLFSLTGASGTYSKYVEAQSGIKVNLQALNPKFGTGLTSNYNSSTNALDVAVDTTTIALKNELFSGDYNDLTNKPTIPTKTSELTNDSNFIPSALGNTKAYSIYETVPLGDTWSRATYTTKSIFYETQDNNSLLNFPTGKSGIIAVTGDIPNATSQLTNDSGFITSSALSDCVKYERVSDMPLIEAGNYYGPGYEPGLTNYNMLTSTRNTFKLPVDKSGTIALTSDIPSMPTNYVTTDTTQTITARKTIVGASEGLYIQSGPNWTSYDTMILPGQIMTNSISGTSISASNELVFGDVTTVGQGQIRVRDFTQNPFVDYRIEVPTKNGTMALTSDIPTVPTNVSAFTNDAGYITGITSSDVTTALGYTPGTSNFSGSYTDLTDKPTIPDAVSGTNDGTNWTSLTIGNDTYAIGGGSTPSNMVTTNTAQNITGAKTFLGVDVLKLQGPASSSKPGFAVNESDGTKRGFLELRPASGDQTMVLGVTNGVPGHSDFRPGLREFNNTSNYTYSTLMPLGSNKYTTFGTGNMNMVLGVNGVKAGADGNIVQATETLTFTYSDNTTATFTFVKV